ncbi:MAG TPA: DUF2306 domain-containing protein [Hyphomicrobium sp.]
MPAGEFVFRARRLAAQTPRLAAIFVVLLLAVPTALVAIAEGAALLPLPFNLFLVDQRLPGIFKLHMLASGAALLLIPLTIAVRRDRSWHKPLGRLTAGLVLLGGLTSLPVAVFSHSVAMARAGFFAQGIVWLLLIALGIAAVRQRRFADHARLMLAMAAVASGALWVRLTTAVVTSYGLPFDPVYGCVAWLGWMVPLAIVVVIPMPYAPARR